MEIFFGRGKEASMLVAGFRQDHGSDSNSSWLG